MRWRLIVLGALAVVLAGIVAYSVVASAELQARAMAIYSAVGQTEGPSSAQEAETMRLYRQASAFQLLVTPLSIGSLTCALAIPLTLGRRRQVRGAESRMAQSRVAQSPVAPSSGEVPAS